MGIVLHSCMAFCVIMSIVTGISRNNKEFSLEGQSCARNTRNSGFIEVAGREHGPLYPLHQNRQKLLKLSCLLRRKFKLGKRVSG